MINGERVNVGVVVLFGDKSRPHSLRVLMPSGNEYVIKKTETDPKRKEASPMGAVRSSTGSASNKKVTQPSPEVKRNSDRDTESVSDRSLLANAFEDLATTELERKKLAEYREKIETLNRDEAELPKMQITIFILCNLSLTELVTTSFPWTSFML